MPDIQSDNKDSSLPRTPRDGALPPRGDFSFALHGAGSSRTRLIRKRLADPPSLLAHRRFLESCTSERDVMTFDDDCQPPSKSYRPYVKMFIWEQRP